MSKIRFAYAPLSSPRQSSIDLDSALGLSGRFWFFNDCEVRAVWDEEHSKWWFSVPDVVGVLNAQDDYTKNRNYWKYLKNKLKADGNEVVSETNQLRLTAPDGKKRLTDVLDSAGIAELAKSMPNNKAAGFIEWFTNGENTIDGKSKAKAYALFESSLLDSIEVGTLNELQKDALTDKVDDREIFMKGIDYSYYYENA